MEKSIEYTLKSFYSFHKILVDSREKFSRLKSCNNFRWKHLEVFYNVKKVEMTW